MLYDKSPSSFNDLTHCQLQSVVDTMPHNPFVLFLGVLLQAQARFLQCFYVHHPKKMMPPNVSLIFTRSAAVQQALMIARNDEKYFAFQTNLTSQVLHLHSWVFYLQTNLQATVMFFTNSTEY